MAFPLTDREHQAIKARIDSQEELIVAAAIRYDGAIVMVERPGRHGNCLNWFSRNTGVKRDVQHDCGFVTSRGRFVDRVEAGRIVRASNQGSPRTEPEGINPMGALFSEDMWDDEWN